MIIRKARIEDARQISRMVCDCLRYVVSKDYPKKQIDNLSYYYKTKRLREKTLRDDRVKKVLVDENNKILAFGVINIFEREFCALYVKHTIHNKGLGTKMLGHLEEIAIKSGVKELLVYSTLTSEKYYRRNGYIKIKKIISKKNGPAMTSILITSQKL